jgi:hypothetical protein
MNAAVVAKGENARSALECGSLLPLFPGRLAGGLVIPCVSEEDGREQARDVKAAVSLPLSEEKGCRAPKRRWYLVSCLRGSRHDSAPKERSSLAHGVGRGVGTRPPSPLCSPARAGEGVPKTGRRRSDPGLASWAKISRPLGAFEGRVPPGCNLSTSFGDSTLAVC